MTHADPQFHYALKIAYDGTRYFGWQKTATGPSIEEALQKTLEQILQQPITLQAASRTDRGVHALGQIVDFFTCSPIRDLSRCMISINQLLPEDICCRDICQIDDMAFHPTLSAIGKKYEYRVSIGKTQSPLSRLYSWHVRDSIHIERMRATAQHFLGTHDFYGYCNQRANLKYASSIRTLSEVSIQKRSMHGFEELVFTLQGDSFLYKMVRNIVGTLVWIGVGKLPEHAATIALITRKRIEAGVTAPAHGLSLIDVLYPQDIFHIDSKE